MTQEELIDQAADIYESHRQMGAQSREASKQMFKRLIQSTVDKAVTASTDFRFATGRKTHTFTDTTAVLELKGANSDSRDIYTILWGGTGKFLPKYGDFAKDVSFSGSSITGTPFGWLRRENGNSGYPNIEILGAVKSGDTMTYKYLKSGITFADWPTDFAYVIRDGVLAAANRPLFRTQYNNSLQQIRDFFESPTLGGSVALPDGVIGSNNYDTNTKRYVG